MLPGVKRDKIGAPNPKFREQLTWLFEGSVVKQLGYKIKAEFFGCFRKQINIGY